MIKEKLSGYNRSIQVASSWFLKEEIPYNFFTELWSDEEIDKWIEERLAIDYETWETEYVWEQIEDLAYLLRTYDEEEGE